MIIIIIQLKNCFDGSVMETLMNNGFETIDPLSTHPSCIPPPHETLMESSLTRRVVEAPWNILCLISCLKFVDSNMLFLLGNWLAFLMLLWCLVLMFPPSTMHFDCCLVAWSWIPSFAPLSFRPPLVDFSNREDSPWTHYWCNFPSMTLWLISSIIRSCSFLPNSISIYVMSYYLW